MRRFNELSDFEKEIAINLCFKDIITSACYLDLVYDDIMIQSRIDHAIHMAIVDGKTLGAHQYIDEDPFLKDFLVADAERIANQGWYPDSSEVVIDLFKDTIPAPPGEFN